MQDLRVITKAAIDNRRVIGGERNNLMMINPVKHHWARDLFKVMQNNTWGQHEVDLTTDAKQYSTGALVAGELTCYKRALAFVSNLDGFQLNNLVNNINQHVTSPEINQCLVRQAWEEALHVEAYAQMIETIGFDPIEIYWMYEQDGVLATKNAHIAAQSAALSEEFTPRNFALAVAANIALEGIYFYSAFLAFYTLARMGKMSGSAKMVKLIQRDERTHLHLFLKIWETMKIENPELFTSEFYAEVRKLLHTAVDLESAWGAHLIEGGVLGLTPTIMRGFCEWRGDECARDMGLGVLYGTPNPTPWFEKYAQSNDSDTNFFENKVDNYGATLDW